MDFEQIIADYRTWLILLGLVAAPFVLLPLLIKAVQKFRRDFAIDEFDPEKTPPPREIADYFAKSIEQFESLGFRVAHHFLLPDLITNVTAIFVIVEDRETGYVGMAAVLYAFADESRQKVVMQESYVEFSTDFTDGTQINTGNTNQLSPFALTEWRTIYTMPQVSDVKTLFAAHRGLVEQRGRPRQPLPLPGEWEEELRDDIVREFTGQVETGYLRISGEFFVPTWKGAFLMTWKEMWPISRIRRARRRRQARQILQAMEA